MAKSSAEIRRQINILELEAQAASEQEATEAYWAAQRAEAERQRQSELALKEAIQSENTRIAEVIASWNRPKPVRAESAPTPCFYFSSVRPGESCSLYPRYDRCWQCIHRPKW